MTDSADDDSPRQRNRLMPSQDVPREIRKTEEERRRDWINFMEAVGKLWIAAEEFWLSGGTASKAHE
ncbi:hypothetical protein K435DRAFT_874774 [Dendrothele bispora CBS 962.96]|uniref:Uncharacterized protein n=1 Tax=Dendrothele bispora (strain CBS 962.96) TaxID=1314807 RepID=A0A4S8KVW9_DENBC|nr:hypothetical protein K435DRAFT_874774 [Dendrothele bispora CBS 962.96]